jgi:hypothetical protein
MLAVGVESATLSYAVLLPLFVSKNCIVPIGPIVSGGREHWPRLQLSNCGVPSNEWPRSVATA